MEAYVLGLPMFFSTEIPRESSPCDDLGFFIGLDKSAEEWAEEILGETKNAMSNRGDREVDVQNAGFDSAEEGIKLTKYYQSIL